MVHFIIYNLIVNGFKVKFKEANLSRLHGSLLMFIIDMLIAYNVDILIIKIPFCALATLFALNVLRRIPVYFKRAEMVRRWREYYPDVDGLNELICAIKFCQSEKYRVNQLQEDSIDSYDPDFSRNDKVFDAVEEASRKMSIRLKNHEINKEEIINKLQEISKLLNSTLDTRNFSPEYLERTLPKEIISIAENEHESL